MGWKVQHLAEEDVVEVTAEGLHDRTMLRDLTRDAVMAGHQFRTARFLIDHRRTRLALGAAEIAATEPTYVADIGLAHGQPLHAAFLDQRVPVARGGACILGGINGSHDERF